MRSTEIFSLLAAQAPQNTGSLANALLMPILVIIIMYFLLFRPQQLKQKELAARISKIKIGDKILTNSGIHGMVANVKERTLMVKVADNVKIEMEKAAVANIFPKDEGKEDASTEAEDAKESA